MSQKNFTSHGHPIPGAPYRPDQQPRNVARCGGPGLCPDCSREAGHGNRKNRMTTIDHQQAAIRAIAAALHGDACPADPDPGESCGCGDYEREAEIALAAALPIIKQAVQEARAEEIRDLVSDKPENPYMYNPWDDSSIDPTNLDEVVGAAVSCGWGSGYYEGVQAVLALLEGGDNQ